MKKLIAILVLLVGFTSQAQKRKKGNFKKLTTEQETNLAVKKMTLQLDLSPKQISKIRPLIAEKVAHRNAMHEKRKALKNSDRKPTADERYAMKSQKLDRMIAFKAEMKRILDDKQYEKFEKISARKKHKMKKQNKRKNKKRHRE